MLPKYDYEHSSGELSDIELGYEEVSASYDLMLLISTVSRAMIIVTWKARTCFLRRKWYMGQCSGFTTRQPVRGQCLFIQIGSELIIYTLNQRI